jgi:DNA mismatch endonuclease (patch repair protein)
MEPDKKDVPISERITQRNLIKWLVWSQNMNVKKKTEIRKDPLSSEQRSYCMSKVKSKNTKIEVRVRSDLFKLGYRFNKHSNELPGKPDIVFPSKNVAIFVDGDFWHGRNFYKWCGKLTPFWKNKIANNIKRDRRNFRQLRSQGWKVLRVWEKKYLEDPEKELFKIIALINL